MKSSAKKRIKRLGSGRYKSWKIGYRHKLTLKIGLTKQKRSKIYTLSSLRLVKKLFSQTSKK